MCAAREVGPGSCSSRASLEISISRVPEPAEGAKGYVNFGNEDRALRYFRQRGLPGCWLMTTSPSPIICVVTRRVLRCVLPRLSRDIPREVLDDQVTHTPHSSTSTVYNGAYRGLPRRDRHISLRRRDPCVEGIRSVVASGSFRRGAWPR